MANLHYKSDAIAQFYTQNRVRWEHLYPSEQFVFERVFRDHRAIRSVLDAGCACGGLGRALHERFGLGGYIGVDINPGAIERAQSDAATYPMPVRFECADIAEDLDFLRGQRFDLVVSLSCADWNSDTQRIINRCWERTAEGGYFVLSFRLTNQRTLNDMRVSFQRVAFEGIESRSSDEKAPYVVTNVWEMLAMVNALQPRPGRLLGYGYWGKPSAMATLPYESIVFSVLALHKKSDGTAAMSELLLPLDLYAPRASD
jgi:SAM-dependent methyltransferase